MKKQAYNATAKFQPVFFFKVIAIHSRTLFCNVHRFLAYSWFTPLPNTTLAIIALVSLANSMLRVFSNRSLITDFPTPDRLLPTTAMFSVSLYINPVGKEVMVFYTADRRGYSALRPTYLPEKAPVAPVVELSSLPNPLRKRPKSLRQRLSFSLCERRAKGGLR
jgi:hypothetical protein